MPKQGSALEQLAKLRKDRLALDAREAQLRREAAHELGAMLMAAGADSIAPEGLKRVLQLVTKLGVEEALTRLNGPNLAASTSGQKGADPDVAAAA